MPRYKDNPEQYVYNSSTKRHVLKGSQSHKKAIKDGIGLVETVTMFPKPLAPPPVVPFPPEPEVKEIKPHIGAPLPEPTPAPVDEKAEVQRMRQQIQMLIRAELAAKPQVYEDKSADEMARMFRQMLVKKLTQEPTTSAQLARSRDDKPRSGPRAKFKLRPP